VDLLSSLKVHVDPKTQNARVSDFLLQELLCIQASSGGMVRLLLCWAREEGTQQDDEPKLSQTLQPLLLSLSLRASRRPGVWGDEAFFCLGQAKQVICDAQMSCSLNTSQRKERNKTMVHPPKTDYLI